MRECVCATLQAPWVLPGHLFCAQQGPGTLLHPAEGSGARTGQSEKTHSKSLAPRLLSELQGHICETGQRLLRNPPPPALLGAPLELCALPYSGRPSPPRSLRLLQAHAPSADQGGVVTCVRPSAWQARSPREQHWQVAPRGRRSTGHILFLDLQASYLHAHLVRCVTWRFMIRAPVCSAFLCSSSGEPAARIGGGRGGTGRPGTECAKLSPPWLSATQWNAGQGPPTVKVSARHPVPGSGAPTCHRPTHAVHYFKYLGGFSLKKMVSFQGRARMTFSTSLHTASPSHSGGLGYKHVTPRS